MKKKYVLISFIVLFYMVSSSNHVYIDEDSANEVIAEKFQKKDYDTIYSGFHKIAMADYDGSQTGIVGIISEEEEWNQFVESELPEIAIMENKNHIEDIDWNYESVLIYICSRKSDRYAVIKPIINICISEETLSIVESKNRQPDEKISCLSIFISAYSQD